MILWIIFSESGPVGPGPAEALIVTFANFCLYMIPIRAQQKRKPTCIGFLFA